MSQFLKAYNSFQFVKLLQFWNVTEFEQASRAIQLLEWRRNHKFCSHCGTATEVHATEYAMVCPACGYHQYPRVNPVSLPSLPVVRMKSYWQKMRIMHGKCMGLLQVLLKLAKL